MADKADKFSLGPVIMMFVAVLLGAIFTGVIADSQVANTELSTVTNESITMTSDIGQNFNESVTISSGIGQLSRAGIRNISFFGNVSNNTAEFPGINARDEINWTRSGILIVSQEVFEGASPYNVSYTYDDNVTGTAANEDIVLVTFFGDANVSTHHDTIVLGVEVNFTKATGVVDVAAANFTDKNYNISTTFEGNLYVADTKSHTFLKLLALFFVIAVLAAAIFGVKKVSDDFNFGG